LSRVNRAAGSAAIAVSAELFEVTRRACDAARRSGGVYDPTVLPLMRLYGFYGAPCDGLPSARAIDAPLAHMGHAHVVMDATRRTLGLARAGMGLDLGSIGKGWAVDRAVDALRDAGVTDGLVDAGGNLYAFGVPEDGAQGWSVGVLHPVEHRVERT